jgi:hypothetical protein
VLLGLNCSQVQGGWARWWCCCSPGLGYHCIVAGVGANDTLYNECLTKHCVNKQCVSLTCASYSRSPLP